MTIGRAMDRALSLLVVGEAARKAAQDFEACFAGFRASVAAIPERSGDLGKRAANAEAAQLPKPHPDMPRRT